LEFFRKYD